MVACISLVLALGAPAWADDLQSIRQAGEIRWGGDQEGGGPFVYPRDDAPDQVTGFEVDLADKLGQYLGVKATFTQGQWDKQPDMLRAGKVDVLLNGYEFTPERVEVMDATMPYYVYGLQLLCRTGDQTFTSWESLRANKARVGVLTGSAAETQMREFCGDSCEVINYDGSTDAMREVENGKLDATLQDTPVASFYAPRFPGLTKVGDPVGEGYYVAYVRKGEDALLQALNEALVLMVRNGDLESVYTKYGIWDKNQEKLAPIADSARFFGMEKAASVEIAKNEIPTEEAVTVEARKKGWDVVKSYGGIMVSSAGMTVLLAFLSFPMAVAAGLGIAVARLYGPTWARLLLTGYVEFLRGTPVMLQLYFVFFFLPELGINIPAFWCGVLGLAVNYSAYESEIYRAGLQAIPIGQTEAALSLGMSRGQAIRRIVVPQAARMVIPPVMNDFIALFKDTSVCSVITIVELTKRFSVLSMSTQATIELMAMTAILYLGMSYPMSLFARHIEKRLGLQQVSV